MKFPDTEREAYELLHTLEASLRHLTTSTQMLRIVVPPLSQDREMEGAVRRMGEAAMLVRAQANTLRDYIREEWG